MEEDQDNFMEIANDEGPEDNAEQENNRDVLCAIVSLVLLLLLVIFLYCVIANLVDRWYANVLLIGFMISFISCFFFWLWLAMKSERGETSSVMPEGLRRRAAQEVQTAPVRRIRETGQRQHIDPARASTSSRASFLDTAPGPSGLQNPVVVFSSGHSCRNLQPVQERTQSESPLLQELLRSRSGEPTADPKMSDIASEASGIPSKKTTERERIRTRSMTRQQLSEASTSAAGQPTDPSVPGPSHLHTPEFHGLSESSVRQLRSSKKKIETESQHSDRLSVLKSPVSGESTVASRGVRRREKFAARKGSVEKKLDSDDSESADSELE